MDMLIMPYLDFAEASPSFIHKLALLLSTVNTAFNANVGRLLCSYLSGKPLLKVPQMRLHSWLTPPLQYVPTAPGCASLSKGSEIHLRSANSCADPAACCHQDEVWLSLSPLPPQPADCVLCSNSLRAARPSRTFLSSDLITDTTGMYSLLFCSVSSSMQPSSHEAGGWSLHRGLRWGRQLALLHLVVTSCWVSSYTVHIISTSIQESIQSTLLCHNTFIANGDYIF